MAYWLKVSRGRDHTYDEFGHQVDYCVTRYFGPFKYLSDAEAEMDNPHEVYEVLEFDG